MTQHLALSKPTVTRGGTTLAVNASPSPVARALVASCARAEGVEERFDVQPDGVELTWTFAARPAGEGDLVVRYAVHTSLGEPTAVDGGLLFACDHGGVRIGRVTGVDARGRRVGGAVQWDGSGVAFSLPASFVDGAAYPIVLDPTMGTTFTVNGSITGIDSDPDAAYDATTDRWLVVWLKTFSATDVRPDCQAERRTGRARHAQRTVREGPLCADVDGFSLHAAVRVAARDRDRLEYLCRYAGRPAIAESRLSLLPDGRVSYQPKKRWKDGTTNVVLEPQVLIERLCALVPRPRPPSGDVPRRAVPGGRHPAVDRTACRGRRRRCLSACSGGSGRRRPSPRA
ncbi:MAG TPA: transposase [Planctomycetota bacterium]|nr:transposase [Planctomycetota bacterium]